MSEFEHYLDCYLTRIAPREVQTFLWAQVPDALNQLEFVGVGDRPSHQSGGPPVSVPSSFQPTG